MFIPIPIKKQKKLFKYAKAEGLLYKKENNRLFNDIFFNNNNMYWENKGHYSCCVYFQKNIY